MKFSAVNHNILFLHNMLGQMNHYLKHSLNTFNVFVSYLFYKQFNIFFVLLGYLLCVCACARVKNPT